MYATNMAAFYQWWLNLKQSLVAGVSGFVLGLGLIVSEMVNPERVLGFLDILGNWDSTLGFVMLGAALVATTGYQLVFFRTKPLLSSSFSLPKHRIVDRRLITDAAIFGVGWGLSGICPGPAVVGLSTFSIDYIIFFVAMFLGMKLFDLWG